MSEIVWKFDPMKFVAILEKFLSETFYIYLGQLLSIHSFINLIGSYSSYTYLCLATVKICLYNMLVNRMKVGEIIE